MSSELTGLRMFCGIWPVSWKMYTIGYRDYKFNSNTLVILMGQIIQN